MYESCVASCASRFDIVPGRSLSIPEDVRKGAFGFPQGASLSTDCLSCFCSACQGSPVPMAEARVLCGFVPGDRDREIKRKREREWVSDECTASVRFASGRYKLLPVRPAFVPYRLAETGFACFRRSHFDFPSSVSLSSSAFDVVSVFRDGMLLRWSSAPPRAAARAAPPRATPCGVAAGRRRASQAAPRRPRLAGRAARLRRAAPPRRLTAWPRRTPRGRELHNTLFLLTKKRRGNSRTMPMLSFALMLCL